ncbi:hypothetical protein PsYK624_146820 [Phanerochaete sordida]|uniref:Uncharacterized protein n=1 Tax=Phanerochaete sordida TaxID=48140 RepID=A0A9P3GN30_9APHY|nr:hypothetical protein PsYK624_146820 [Phanerochaete sordida]
MTSEGRPAPCRWTTNPNKRSRFGVHFTRHADRRISDSASTPAIARCPLHCTCRDEDGHVMRSSTARRPSPGRAKRTYRPSQDGYRHQPSLLMR